MRNINVCVVDKIQIDSEAKDKRLLLFKDENNNDFESVRVAKIFKSVPDTKKRMIGWALLSEKVPLFNSGMKLTKEKGDKLLS